MSPNKQTVQRYMDGFTRSDHAAILSCLTDDVEWLIPGAFHLTGKIAFDREIENDAFVGSPTISVSRMLEEHDVVVAEGSVRSARKDGTRVSTARRPARPLTSPISRRRTTGLRWRSPRPASPGSR